MSTLSSSTEPDSAAEGMSSCIRLRMRRNVDFPQPDGPMSAVTLPGSIASDTRSSTFFEPNQALTLVARSPERPAASCMGGGAVA